MERERDAEAGSDGGTALSWQLRGLSFCRLLAKPCFLPSDIRGGGKKVRPRPLSWESGLLPCWVYKQNNNPKYQSIQNENIKKCLLDQG